MRIVILSDIHDNVWNLAATLHGCGDAAALICCGDLCSPFVLDQLADGFAGPIHIVFGNNDGDLFRITAKASRRGHVHLHGAFFAGELGGTRVAVNHYPDIARPIAASGLYDVVCCGHNHTYAIEQVGATLLLNPGTLLGFEPVSKRDVAATFIVYDTVTGAATGYKVEPQTGRSDARTVVPLA